MARLYTSGFSELEDELIKMRQDTRPLITAMVQQGCELMKQQRITTALAYGHVKSGDMIKGIGYAKNPRSVAGVVRNDVFSRGKGSNGTRNAEKEFLLNYGWDDYNADHWVEEAEKLGSEIAYDKMSSMVDYYIRTGNVPKVVVQKNRRE